MIDIDTDKIRECGNDIIRLSQELNSLINTIYNRVGNVPSVTKEWVGDNSTLFSKTVYDKKTEFVELKDGFYNLGNELLEVANKYEKTTRELL